MLSGIIVVHPLLSGSVLVRVQLEQPISFQGVMSAADGLPRKEEDVPRLRDHPDHFGWLAEQ